MIRGLYNGILKLILLVTLTCNICSSFAQTQQLKEDYTSGQKAFETNVYTEYNSRWGGKNTFDITNSSTIVVIQGNFTIGSNTHVLVSKGATLIVEGNLYLNGELEIWAGGNVTGKKKIYGTGTLDMEYVTTSTGYFTVLGGLGENANIRYENVRPDEVAEDIYISGETYDYWVGYGWDRHKESVSISNTFSDAYTISQTKLEAAANAGLLPIELVLFQVFKTTDLYIFNWVTASEVNNDYYTLEYSIDGVDFNEIDFVHGAGTTSETSEYEYRWDDAPDFELVYFRLKQTDYNGEYSYSDVIVASRKKTSGANGTFRYGPLNLQIVDGQLQYIEK